MKTIPYKLLIIQLLLVVGFYANAQWLNGTLENVNANPIYVNGTLTNGIYIGKGAVPHDESVGFGANALSISTGFGGGNTAIGVNSMRYLTNSFGNTGVGVGTLQNLDTGIRNVALGYWALKFRNTPPEGYRGGKENIAIGYTAMAESYNVGSGYLNNSGNVAIGNESLRTNNGDGNVAIGNLTLKTNTSGFQNIAIGIFSMEFTNTSGNNICLGSQTMRSADNANSNIAIGNGSQLIASNSSNNIGIGSNSLYKTSGQKNVSVGLNSLFNLTSVNYNIALGNNALTTTVMGDNNVGIGNGADFPLATTGSNRLNIQNVLYGSSMSNAANGRIAIGGNTTPVSAGSLYPNQTPKLDVHGTLRIGTVIDGPNQSGKYLFIDADGMVAKSSQSFVSSTCSTQYYLPVVTANGGNNLSCSQVYDNGTSVGINTTGPFTYSGTNNGQLGSPTPTTGSTFKFVVNGWSASTGYIATSDARLKKDIKKIEGPLSKIKSITGYTYFWNKDANKEYQFDDNRHAGFLAQEIEKILPEAVIIKEDGTYGLNYDAIMPLLAEGIKAQQKQIEELQLKNDKLQKQLNELSRQFTITTNASNKITVSSFDVVPNPITGNASIVYNIGENIAAAKILVTDLQGKTVKQFVLRNANGRISFSKSGFAAGMYIFSLLSGVEELVSKKIMISQ